MCRIMIEEKIKGQIENMCKNVDVQFHSSTSNANTGEVQNRKESMVLDSRPEILALRAPTPKT